MHLRPVYLKFWSGPSPTLPLSLRTWSFDVEGANGWWWLKYNADFFKPLVLYRYKPEHMSYIGQKVIWRQLNQEIIACES